MSASTTTLWQCFSVRDAAVTADWLRAVGFTEHATYRDEDDPAVVVHAEWVWPGGGGLMFGTEREAGGLHNTGSSSTYLVCDDPVAVAERAVAAGGTLVDPVSVKEYGGASGTVRDPDGNTWSLGTYQPS